MNKSIARFLALVIFFSCIGVFIAFKTGLLAKVRTGEPEAPDSLGTAVPKDRTMMSTSKSTVIIQNETGNPMHLALDSAPPRKPDTTASVPAKLKMNAMSSSKSVILMPQHILKKPDSLKESHDSILP